LAYQPLKPRADSQQFWAVMDRDGGRRQRTLDVRNGEVYLSCGSWQILAVRQCTIGQTESDSRDESALDDQPGPLMAGPLHQAYGQYCLQYP
jgi:hypothetical protein